MPSIKENIGFGAALSTEGISLWRRPVIQCSCLLCIQWVYSMTCSMCVVYVYVFSVLYVCVLVCVFVQPIVAQGQTCWGFVVTATNRSQACGFKWAVNHQTGHTDEQEGWRSRHEYWIKKIAGHEVLLHWKDKNFACVCVCVCVFFPFFCLSLSCLAGTLWAGFVNATGSTWSVFQEYFRHFKCLHSL